MRDTKNTLSKFKIIYISETTSRGAIQLVEKYFLLHKLLFFDALIASTALENNLKLVTANLKHFKMIKGLKVDKW